MDAESAYRGGSDAFFRILEAIIVTTAPIISPNDAPTARPKFVPESRPRKTEGSPRL